MSHKLLLVCTGNTCRSPMAAALLQKIVSENWEVYSAGIGAWDGQPPSPEATQVMAEEGVDLSGHKSAKIHSKMVKEADLILTMGMMHKQYIENTFPAAAGKVYTLKEYALQEESSKNNGKMEEFSCELDIDDPFGQGLDAYRRCLRELKECLAKIKQKMTD